MSLPNPLRLPPTGDTAAARRRWRYRISLVTNGGNRYSRELVLTTEEAPRVVLIATALMRREHPEIASESIIPDIVERVGMV